MVSQKTMAWSAAGFALYFGVFGIQNGFLIIFSVSSFLIGGRIGCSNNLYTSVLICAIILLHVYGIGAEECSRKRSRQARTIINTLVSPRYELERLSVPTSCPLSPANDQYAAHEIMKRRLGREWMCSACSKTYAEEAELEAHLDEAHTIHKTIGCLADYCDILRCEPFFDIHKDHPNCDETSMAELKMQCMNMVKDECSPTHLQPTERLQVEVDVQASICSYLTCEDYWTVPEEDGFQVQRYYTTYAVAFAVLLMLLAIYFKIASSNIDKSVSIQQILAEADRYERVKPAVIPPDNVEIRHRTPNAQRQWSENE